MRLIDADAIRVKPEYMASICGIAMIRVEDLARILNEQPTIPAGEELVMCKDCRYGQYCTDGETTYECYKWDSSEFGVLHEQDWFCADGERK